MSENPFTIRGVISSTVRAVDAVTYGRARVGSCLLRKGFPLKPLMKDDDGSLRYRSIRNSI